MSELKIATLSDKAGTGPVTLTGQVAVKAWGNLNGLGAIAYRNSFNISSVTDNGTGDYTHTFTNPMADANYSSFGATNGTGSVSSTNTYSPWIHAGQAIPTASTYRTISMSGGGTPIDVGFLHVGMVGDLA